MGRHIDFWLPIIFLIGLVCWATSCYNVVDAEKVSDSNLYCFPCENMAIAVAWCDPGHFHVTYPIDGGTVSVSGGGLPTTLCCPVTPFEGDEAG